MLSTSKYTHILKAPAYISRSFFAVHIDSINEYLVFISSLIKPYLFLKQIYILFFLHYTNLLQEFCAIHVLYYQTKVFYNIVARKIDLVCFIFKTLFRLIAISNFIQLFPAVTSFRFNRIGGSILKASNYNFIMRNNVNTESVEYIFKELETYKQS